jgi:hypothetical protein
MKTLIKLNFADFRLHFDKEENYFVQLLSRDYQVELSDDQDFLVYFSCGSCHFRYSC